MTIINPYTAKCLKCGHKELRFGLMSFNTMVGMPNDLVEEYPVGCPECGDVDFDVYDEDEDEDEDEDG